MSRSVEIKFKYTGTDSEIKKITDAVRGTGAAAKASTGDLALFEQILKADASAGVALSKTLKDIQANASGATAGAKALASAVQSHVKELENFGKEGKKALDTGEKLERLFIRLGGRLAGRTTGIPGGSYIGGSIASSFGLSGGGGLAVGAGLAGVFAAFEAGRKLLDLTKWAQDQKNLAAEIGVTVTEMQTLTRISEQTGVKLDAVAKASGELGTKLLEGGARARDIQEALRTLGLTTGTAFEGSVQAMNDIAAALARIPDEATRSQLAVKLLGDQGRALAGVAEDLQKKRDLHLIDEKTIKELADAREKIKEMGESWDVLLSKAAKPLSFIVNFLDNSSFGSVLPGSGRVQGRGVPGLFGSGFLGAADKGFGPTRTGVGADRDPRLGVPSGLPNLSFSGAPESLGVKPFSPEYPFSLQGQVDYNSLQQRRRVSLVQQLLEGGETKRKDLTEQLSDQQSVARTAGEAYARAGSPEDLTKLKEAESAITKLNAAIAALKKEAEPFAEALSKYANKDESNSLLKQLNANRDEANDLRRRYPGNSPAIGAQESLNTKEIFTKYYEKSNEAIAKLVDEQEKERLTKDRLDAEVIKGSTERGIKAIGDPDSPLYKLGNFSATGPGNTRSYDQQQRVVQDTLANTRSLISQRSALAGRGEGPQDFQDELSAQKQAIAAELRISEERAKSIVNSEAREKAIEDARFAAEEKIFEARQDFANKIADLEAKNLAAYRSQTGSIFDAIVSRDPSKSLRTFGVDLAKQQGKIVFENLFTPITEGIGNSLAAVGGQTGLGSTVLKGTMFDPGKSSVLDATGKNTDALGALTKAVSDLRGTLDGTKSSTSISGQGVIGTTSDLTETIGSLDRTLGGTGGASSSGGSAPGTNLTGGGVDFGGPLTTAVSIARAVGGPATGSVASSAGSALGSLMRIFRGGSTSSGGEQIGSLDDNIATSDPNDYGAGSYSGGGLSYPSLGTGGGSSTPSGGLSFPSLGLGTADSPQAQQQQAQNVGTILGAASKAAGGATSNGGLMANLSGQNGAGGVLGAGLGLAGAGYGVYQGVSTALGGHGARGITAGIGETAMSIAPFLGPAAPFVAAGGAVLSLISSLLGDPKSQRQSEISNELIGARYNAPEGVSVAEASGGDAVSFDYKGNARVLNSTPSIGYYTKVTGVNPTKPSNLLSYQQPIVDYSASPGFTPPPVQQQGGAAFGTLPGQSAPQILVQVSTMDSKSFSDNWKNVGDAMTKAIQNGHRVRGDIQKFTNPN